MYSRIYKVKLLLGEYYSSDQSPGSFYSPVISWVLPPAPRVLSSTSILFNRLMQSVLLCDGEVRQAPGTVAGIISVIARIWGALRRAGWGWRGPWGRLGAAGGHWCALRGCSPGRCMGFSFNFLNGSRNQSGFFFPFCLVLGAGCSHGK